MRDEWILIAQIMHKMCIRDRGESPRGTAPFTFEQFAQDLEDFMDEHGIFRANILGFSDGGITALIFALTRPERVNKLILNGANLDPEGVVEPLRTKIQEKAKEAAQTKDESAENMQRYENLRLMAEQPSIDPKAVSYTHLDVYKRQPRVLASVAKRTTTKILRST